MSPMLHLLEVGMHKLDTAPAPLLCLPALSLLVVLCPGEPLRVLGAAPVNMDGGKLGWKTRVQINKRHDVEN